MGALPDLPPDALLTLLAAVAAASDAAHVLRLALVRPRWAAPWRC
jgi:hypothetical protein